MILQYLATAWTTVSPAIANHLWQSTLFFVVTGGLTLALRENPARIRYRLWPAFP